MFEIEIPIENGGISHIDDLNTPITTDLLICAKPGQVRHTHFPFTCYYVHMMLGEGELYDRLMALPSFIKTERGEKYVDIFKRLCKYYDTALEDDEMILQSLILELIHRLCRDTAYTSASGAARSGGYSVIENTVGYIKENLTSDLSLETVAAHSGFSPVYFHNYFKRATGKTLRKYVEEQRIKKAANMIVTTEYTLTDIAYECGFSSQSYFSYAFKRRMGMTPREYAKSVFRRYEGEEKE